MVLSRFFIKSSIIGGIIYYTIEEGLWSTPEESAKLYNKLYNNVSPLIQKNVPQEVLQEMHHIPNPGDLKVYTATYWNKGVTASIKFLSELPTHASNGIDRIQKEIEKLNTASSETIKPVETAKPN